MSGLLVAPGWYLKGLGGRWYGNSKLCTKRPSFRRPKNAHWGPAAEKMSSMRTIAALSTQESRLMLGAVGALLSSRVAQAAWHS